MPSASPVKAQVTAVMFVQVAGVTALGEAVTVYPVMAEPPVFVGAPQETRTMPLSSQAQSPIGAAGT